MFKLRNKRIKNHRWLVLLETAHFKVKDCKGNFQTCRALLDCGSQSNLITDSLVRLGLEQTRNQVPITGINNTTSVTNYNVNLEIITMNNDYTSKMTCLVLPRITKKMPVTDIDISTWKFPFDIVLADRFQQTRTNWHPIRSRNIF